MTGDGWRLDLPPGFVVKEAAAHDYESGAIARGFIGDAPVTVIVQTRAFDGGFNDWVRRFAAPWLEHELRRIPVARANDGVRIEGVVEFDGLGAKDDRERCTAVCAKRGRRLYVLTVRSRPEDGVHDELEAVVASFALVRP